MKHKTKVNFKVWIIVLALITPLVLSQTAGAQDQVCRFIQHFDQNQDGRVSASEFPGPQENFSQLDQNSDGYIDATEAPRKRQRAGMRNGGGFMKRFDTDGNGKISREEFTTSAASHFDRLDKNGDGYIDESEVPQGPPPRGRRNKWSSNDE